VPSPLLAPVTSISTQTCKKCSPYPLCSDSQRPCVPHFLAPLPAHPAQLPPIPTTAHPTPCCSNDKLWRPIAIELHGADDEANVYTPSDPFNLWLLAKGVFSSIDSGYHQLITHWLRTHACTEPYIISTHRNLSSLHPVSPILPQRVACTWHGIACDRVACEACTSSGLSQLTSCCGCILQVTVCITAAGSLWASPRLPTLHRCCDVPLYITVAQRKKKIPASFLGGWLRRSRRSDRGKAPSLRSPTVTAAHVHCPSCSVCNVLAQQPCTRSAVPYVGAPLYYACHHHMPRQHRI
jgi:hypothetical protein